MAIKRKPPAVAAYSSRAMASAAARPVPIVVLHGGPASNIYDLYPTTPTELLTLSRGAFAFPEKPEKWERLRLHPDDPTVTLNASGKMLAPARPAAISAFYFPYEGLVEALKKNVGTPQDPAPVFPFAYDWRHDSLAIAPSLAGFIAEVLRIVAALPAYKPDPPQQVDIVAHSYGGLVTARYLGWCLRQAPAVPPCVRKVVTIATPFRGAVQAVYEMIKEQHKREAVRTMPSAYGLLPSYPGACIDESHDPPVEIDLLRDPAVWERSSVVKTLGDYCKQMGSSLDGAARFAQLRASAQAQQLDLARLDVAAALGSPDAWLPIVGIGEKTKVRALVGRATRKGREFDFETANDAERTGDETVPFAGAIPPFNLATGAPGSDTPRERLVCIKREDVDPGDSTGWINPNALVGPTIHSFLPHMNAVQAIISGFLRRSPPPFKAAAHAAPNVEQVDWPRSWNLKVKP